MPKQRLSLKLNNILKSVTFKSSLTIFRSFIFRLVVQGFYFVILARTLAPERYGAYVAIVAIVAIFLPFASWGSGEVTIQNVSRNPLLAREYWGTTILKTLLFGSGFIVVVLTIYSFISIPNISVYTVFAIALSNLIFLKLNDATRDVFIALGLMNYTARSIIIVSLNRFLAAIALIACFNRPTVFSWSLLYCLATSTAALISSWLAVKQIGYPQFKPKKVGQELGLGFSFAVGASAQIINNSLDKSMLAKLSTLEAAGIYGVAYHIFSVALTPIQSLALASFRKFFQQGSSGIKGSFSLCKKLLPVSLGYSLLAILGLVIFSTFIPLILGSEYQDSTSALIWLSPAILLKTSHFFAADTLTGANLQNVRTIAQVVVAIFNAILNFCLIPLYGWHGAVWATLASEFLLMICLWGAIYKHFQKPNFHF